MLRKLTPAILFLESVVIWYRKQFFLTIVSIFATSAGICQEKAAELHQQLAEVPASLHDSIYFELYKFYRKTDHDSAKHYATLCLKSAVHFSHTKNVSRGYHALGHLYSKEAIFDSATQYYHQAIATSASNKLNSHLVQLYNDLGMLYEGIDVYDSALYYFNACYELALSTGDFKYQIYSNHNQGLVYYHTENYGEALRFFSLAVGLCKEKSVATDKLAAMSLNLIRVYNEMGDQEKAAQLLYEIDSLCTMSECDDFIKAEVYYAHGYLNFRKGDSTNAILSFENAKSLATHIGNYRTVAYSLYYIAAIAFQREGHGAALNYLAEAEKALTNIMPPRRLQNDIFKLYSDIYNQRKDLEKALYYQRLSVEVKDSLFSRTITNNLYQLQLASHEKQANAVISHKDSLLQESHIKMMLIGAICILSFVITFLIYRANKANLSTNRRLAKQAMATTWTYQEKSEELTKSKLEMSLLLLASSQHVLGPLATLNGLMDLFDRMTDHSALKDCIGKIRSAGVRVKVVTRQLAELYGVHKRESLISDIDLYCFSREVLEYFKQHQFNYPLVSVNISGSLTRPLKADKALLLQLLEDVVKYLRNGSDVQCINISFRQNEQFTCITFNDKLRVSPTVAGRNMFNYYLANMTAWKLRGTIHLVKEVGADAQDQLHSGLEVKLPNSLIPVEGETNVEWAVLDSSKFI